MSTRTRIIVGANYDLTNEEYKEEITFSLSGPYVIINVGGKEYEISADNFIRTYRFLCEETNR